jgi:hypothetical protein
MDEDAEIRKTACLPWDRRRLVSRTCSRSTENRIKTGITQSGNTDTALGLVGKVYTH